MQAHNEKTISGLTGIEAMVIAALGAALAILGIVAYQAQRPKAARIKCVNNLKTIGTAYRVWIDSGDRMQMMSSVADGGWRDYMTNGNAGPFCWTNYAIMINELGMEPKILVCPADIRRPAMYFSKSNTSYSANGLFNDNSSVSYFVGVTAGDIFPQSVLGGDRNLGRGLVPKHDFGFSPSGTNGNDVIIQTNSLADPVSWSLEMHSMGNAEGCGNVLHGDGSVWTVTSAEFRANIQPFAEGYDNWVSNVPPALKSFRLVFP